MKTKLHKSHRVLILVLLLSIIFNACKKNHQNPKPGNLYLVQLDTLSYTTWKITKVKSNKIWYIQNDYSVSESIYADSINNPKNYTDLPKILSRKEFKKTQTELIIPKIK